ncbi:MAG: LysM peptidoglycan-binding domain-containing protein [Candidatus Curtissbacteria bacterium]|nr:LysM peptidoglycan-binding domain-containing protein [Candidatus Curtissbacteria bacterium]
MPRKKNTSVIAGFWPIDYRESYPSLILGAIILVILGLLVFNFFNRTRMSQIGSGENTELTTPEGAESDAKKHTVTEGESLAKISETIYGSQDFWPQLAQVNNIANPNVLSAGITLDIPDKVDLEQGKFGAPDVATSYQVKEGDTLFKIAEEVYKDGSRWTEISRANGLGRLPNGNPLVFAGSTISIPR